VAKLTQWRADQLVFLDESAACERTGMTSLSYLASAPADSVLGDRKYGWAPTGLKACQIQDLRRSKRWSILPAFTIDAYIE